MMTPITGQSYQVTLQDEIALSTDHFVGVDSFQNTYYITQNTLYKKQASGIYEYTALNLGAIASVDIINPLKITVFYKNSNTAVILDNTLTEITRINFSSIVAFRNVSHATTAGDRRLWIYNTDVQRLEIFDYNQLKVITEFPPMQEIAKELVSNFNICLIKTTSELQFYNIYGSLIDTTDVDSQYTNLYLNNGNLLGIVDKKLYYKAQTDEKFIPVEIPEISIKQFSINDEILYIYDGQNLTSFLLKLSKE